MIQFDMVSVRCLSTLLQYADELGMIFDWLGYSRKNLLFPSAQLWPHSNFGDEINYLKTHEKLQDRLRGSGHILGIHTPFHTIKKYIAYMYDVRHYVYMQLQCVCI